MKQALILLALSAPALPAGDSKLSIPRLDAAAALLEQHRYTRETALLLKAKQHLAANDSTNVGVKKLMAFAALLEEDYAAARQLATEVNRSMPDDVDVYGYLVEIHMAYGEYKQAEEQANWMLRLRPQHRESMRRAAELREEFGDVEGAVLMLNDLYRAITATEPLQRAWVLARLARLTAATKPERSEKLLREALRIAPDLRAGGAPDAAKLSGAMARIESLIDAGAKAEALRLAEKTAAEFPNMRAVALHALALHENGRSEEARSRMKAALAVGSRDPRLLAWAARVGVNE